MLKINNYLINNDFELNSNSYIKDGDTISHIYTKKDNLIFLIIYPHSDNDNKYNLRVNHADTLDRWNTCDLEYRYDDAIDFIYGFDLIKIYKELLDIYVERNLDE